MDARARYRMYLAVGEAIKKSVSFGSHWADHDLLEMGRAAVMEYSRQSKGSQDV